MEVDRTSKYLERAVVALQILTNISTVGFAGIEDVNNPPQQRWMGHGKFSVCTTTNCIGPSYSIRNLVSIISNTVSSQATAAADFNNLWALLNGSRSGSSPPLSEIARIGWYRLLWVRTGNVIQGPSVPSMEASFCARPARAPLVDRSTRHHETASLWNLGYMPF
ncbi:hypothetical protein E4T56_gene12579 [Termitomyces sp. T112]|nr:hypothetical protein E4T56_gene12579 [Termitomyces sp. T112]